MGVTFFFLFHSFVDLVHVDVGTSEEQGEEVLALSSSPWIHIKTPGCSRRLNDVFQPKAAS